MNEAGIGVGAEGGFFRRRSFGDWKAAAPGPPLLLRLVKIL
jgi:hypothetical protein